MDAHLREALHHSLSILACPKCQADLELDEEGLRCTACRAGYGVADNIPLLFVPNEWDAAKDDVTLTVKSFYEETPFPNYDDFDNVGWLVEKARAGVFAKLLDDQIPPGARILECGCGTGQMSNFLSVASRTVFGSDMSLHSLRLGEEFKEKNDLRTAHFVQMNLFRPCFKPGTFDLVICNGVLHHTSDPYQGFRSIARLVRPKGYVLIGLYHKYGRTITNIRRLIFSMTGDHFAFLDPNLRKRETSASKKRAWLMDQYKHPHESTHTIREAVAWVDRAGLKFVKSIPKTNGRPFSPGERLFAPEPPGSGMRQTLAELRMMMTGSREGGFFIVIAQQP
jgi:SAM-dependent methyltransferase